MNLKLHAIGLLLISLVASRALMAQSPQVSASRRSLSARSELRSVLRLAPDRRHGREEFRVCAVCHGAHDAGLPKGWVPEIAGQHPHVIVKELVDFRHGDRWDLRMEIIAGRHVLKSSQDIADVAAYVGSLRPVQSPVVGNGEHLESGTAVYGRSCAACHGVSAEGSDKQMVPRLAGQDYDYLLRQLHDAIDGRRPGLRAAHGKMLKALDAAELEGLADTLSRLAPSKAD